MFTHDDKRNFYDAIESLKKYRRAELLDDKGRSLLETLYTDLLPSEHVLQKSIRDNTTFLIGRKGTGKSTIFLRIEQELRKRPDVLPCYLDVKSIYESAQTDFINHEYLAEYLSPNLVKKYLIERSFLQNVLKRIAEEIDLRYDTWLYKIKEKFGYKVANETKTKIKNLRQRIEDNEILKEIELPIIKTVSAKRKTFDENKTSIVVEDKASLGLGIDAKGPTGKFDLSDSIKDSEGLTTSNELEENFSSIFLQLFQVKTLIEELNDVLKPVGINHIVILLDDFSEIDDFAIKTFVDVLLAPLNNWSNEFIKFKIAAYPNRIYYGKIDPQKIDTINLDFYNLYSEFDRDKMEEGATDFTKRLIEKRFQHYVGKEPDLFFDTVKLSMEEYYEILFQTSMNVPRIIGYILSYCYQRKIIYNKPISKEDIERASQSYYEEKIEPFFHKTTFSLLSINEKIDTLQLRVLLTRFVEKMSEIKKKIASGEYSGEAYVSTYPYASHFHFVPSLEQYLKSLELNFFISKYNEMSDKDGQSSSIYCLNYGLTQKHNLLWGKPKGGKSRKYFVQRPFNFNVLLKDFLASSKSIHCTNEEATHTFTADEIPLLKFSGFKCNKCGSPVIVEATAKEIINELKQIDETHLLSPADIEIVMELSKREDAVPAREIAEELDFSSQSIAQKSKKLDEKKGLVKREKISGLYMYELTELAKNIYRD